MKEGAKRGFNFKVNTLVGYQKIIIPQTLINTLEIIYQFHFIVAFTGVRLH